jgi:hypothetical protein
MPREDLLLCVSLRVLCETLCNDALLRDGPVGLSFAGSRAILRTSDRAGLAWTGTYGHSPFPGVGREHVSYIDEHRATHALPTLRSRYPCR